MEKCSWIINMVGIVISLLGTVQVFRGTPRDTIGTEMEMKQIDRLRHEEALTKELVKRNKLSQCGIVLLGVGFALQILAQFWVHPF